MPSPEPSAGDKARKTALTAELEALDSLAAAATITDTQIKRELAGCARDVRALLHQHPPQARQMLRKLLDGQKVTLTPFEEGGRRGYRFSGAGTYLRLLPVRGNLPRTVVAPTGFEPVFQP